MLALICISEKLHQGIGRHLGPFLQNPMTGVLRHDDRDIRGHQLHLRCSLPNDLSPPIGSTGMVSFV